MKNYWFVFYKNSLLVNTKDSSCVIPFSILPPFKTAKKNIHHAGIYKKSKCYTFELDKLPKTLKNFELKNLREVFEITNEPLFKLAGKCAEILTWAKESSFCPVCGTKTKAFEYNAKKCPKCAKEIYPNIPAAAMVLVEKGDKILMVRANNFRYKHYGLVAGFLETGESLEECAAREVMEETNIKIKNIRYFASQPWPFPGTIMVGFFADYAGGTLKINSKELSEAKFFTAQELTLLPSKISLARKMIDAWLYKKQASASAQKKI